MLRLLAELSAYFGPLDVFRYITFRTGGAAATAHYLVLWFSPQIAAILRSRLAARPRLRVAGPHHGGSSNRSPLGAHALMIGAGVLFAIVLWANLANVYVWAGVAIVLGLGAIGLYDHDRFVLALLLIAAAALGLVAYQTGNAFFANYLRIPFLPGTGELAVICGALVGAGLAVLRRT